ncbi:hypothetical protein ACAX43_22545 [Paraburkholderia sp. IW21]|uniref:hypothetical protein n=1 Tax=Paraburkholderia sp. IW21 TaxID=3242488 RepID=UPI0035200052
MGAPDLNLCQTAAPSIGDEYTYKWAKRDCEALGAARHPKFVEMFGRKLHSDWRAVVKICRSKKSHGQSRLPSQTMQHFSGRRPMRKFQPKRFSPGANMDNPTNVRSVEYIGISDASLHMGGTDWLKQYLMLYDKIGLLTLEAAKHMLRGYSSVKAERADTYEALQEIGVVFEPDNTFDSERYPGISEHLKQADDAQKRFDYEHPSDLTQWREREQAGRKPAENSFDHYHDARVHLSRASAAVMRATSSSRAFAMFSPAAWEHEAREMKRVQVGKLLIAQFPQIDQTISFQDLLSLRDEDEFKQRQGGLRVWANKATSGSASVPEIEEELLSLRNQYETYLRKIKVKYGLSGVSSLFHLAADGLKMNAGNVLGRFFSLVVTPASLSEAEMKAPGREVSFFHYLENEIK